jgi:hypothetical protein
LNAAMPIGDFAPAGGVDTLLRTEYLGQRYGKFTAVKEVSLSIHAYDHQAIQRYCIGKGKVLKDYSFPIYEPVKWFEVDEVEKSFMLPPDPTKHPVRWRT